MKLLILFYSATAYLFFLVIFTYLNLFLGGSFIDDYLSLPSWLKTIDSGATPLAIPYLPAGLNNFILLIAFSLQHSIMARSGFKKVLTRLIPACAERSTFVLSTCLVLLWLYLGWQPMPTTVWSIDGNMSLLLQLAFVLGGGLVLWSTFMISHWQLFGLSQAWQQFIGKAPSEDKFVVPSMYKFSRHPMYLGVLIVLWATPTMTMGHFLMASIWSIYVFIGIGYEERDMLARFSKQYQDYMQRVPQILPTGTKRSQEI